MFIGLENGGKKTSRHGAFIRAIGRAAPSLPIPFRIS